MKNIKHAGFYLSIEDLNHLDRIMGLLADFVNILLDQTIEGLNQSIKDAEHELNREGKGTN